jgi:putative oxidoreductase
MVSPQYFLKIKKYNGMINIANSTFLLRIAIVIILLSHSLPSIFTGDVNNFGNLYLNKVGFSPIGVPLAWIVKLSHIVVAACFLFEKYVKPAGYFTIFILIMGIIMVHFKEGWFVVGGGRNGWEYNFFLICVILTIMYPQGLKRI